VRKIGSPEVRFTLDQYSIIEDWRTDYNERRPRTSLGGMTPSKFAETKGLRLQADSISFWKKIRGMLASGILNRPVNFVGLHPSQFLY
jgi:hypothetical protein